MPRVPAAVLSLGDGEEEVVRAPLWPPGPGRGQVPEPQFLQERQCCWWSVRAERKRLTVPTSWFHETLHSHGDPVSRALV